MQGMFTDIPEILFRKMELNSRLILIILGSFLFSRAWTADRKINIYHNSRFKESVSRDSAGIESSILFDYSEDHS